MVNNTPNPIKTYYIAYFDILGYKDFFETRKEEIPLFLDKINNCINDTLNFIRGINNSPIVNQIANIDIKVKIFSDNFFICMESFNSPTERNRLLAFIGLIYDIQRRFVVYNEIFIRGSITKGEISFNDNYIFGQGIIDAVSMESAERCPRIIIDNKLIEYLVKNYYSDEDLGRINSIENSINNGNILTSQEYIFYNNAISMLNIQINVLKAINVLVFKFNDKKHFINYLRRFDMKDVFGKDNIKSISEYIKCNYKQDYESFSNIQVEDIDNILTLHRQILVKKLEEFGYNNDTIFGNQELSEYREKILKKYIWATAYHNYICDYYSKSAYCIYVQCNCDALFMTMTAKVQTYDYKI